MFIYHRTCRDVKIENGLVLPDFFRFRILTRCKGLNNNRTDISYSNNLDIHLAATLMFLPATQFKSIL